MAVYIKLVVLGFQNMKLIGINESNKDCNL